MASSKFDLERGKTKFTSERGTQASENPGKASTMSSTGFASNSLQDRGHGGDPVAASTRPLRIPGPGHGETQQDQQTPTTEPDAVHFVRFWSKYNEKAQTHDEALIERLRGSADSLLIFAGLFAATVTAFIIESYKTLSPDSGDTALFYLAFISQQLAATSQSTEQANTTMQLSVPPFVAPRSSVKVNILWILSLIFSIVSALAATLVQSWLTRYKRLVNRSPHPEQQASERSYYFRGITQFRLVALAEVLPALLHISLFLFLAGLVVFLFPINEEVARVITGVITAFAALYLGLTIIPSLARHAPYRAPFTAIYNSLLDVVLRCWIGVIAFCGPPTGHTFGIALRLRFVLSDFGTACATYRKSIWDNDTARKFDDKRTADAREWLISQLTTDDEHEALMNVLVPIFTCPGKVNSEWLELFGTFQPPIPRQFLIPHFPSILDPCLTPVQATVPHRSSNLDRHQRLQHCLAIAIRMVPGGMFHITHDTLPRVPPTLLSLRRLRNDRDPFIASHANMATYLILADILNYSSMFSISDLPSIRLPRNWKHTDMLSWVDSRSNDEFVSRCPIILEVLTTSFLPLSPSIMPDNRLRNRGTHVTPSPVRPGDNIWPELPPGFVRLPTVIPGSEPTRASSDHIDLPPPFSISSDVPQDTQLATSPPMAEGVRITPPPLHSKDSSSAPEPPAVVSQPQIRRAPFRDERKQASNPHPASLSTFSDERHSNLHASHSGTAGLRGNVILTIGECKREEDTIVIPPRDYLSVSSLLALNKLLDQLLDCNRLSNLTPPDPNSFLNIDLLARMAETTVSKVFDQLLELVIDQALFLSLDVELTLIRHTENVVDQLESARSNRQAAGGRFGQSELPPLFRLLTENQVDLIMSIVSKLSDPCAHSRGVELFDMFQERRSVWFPSTSTH